MKEKISCFVLPLKEGNMILPAHAILEFVFLKTFNRVFLKNGLLIGLYAWQGQELPVVLLGMLEPAVGGIEKIMLEKKQKIAILKYPTQEKKAFSFGFLVCDSVEKIQITPALKTSQTLKPIGLVACFCTLEKKIYMIPALEQLVFKLILPK